MPKFLVSLEGKLIVGAGDKDAAKEMVTGILADRQPWLKLSYGDPVRIAEINEVPTDSLVKEEHHGGTN